MTTTRDLDAYSEAIREAELDRLGLVMKAMSVFQEAATSIEIRTAKALIDAPENYGNADGDVGSIFFARNVEWTTALATLQRAVADATRTAENLVIDAANDFAATIDTGENHDD